MTGVCLEGTEGFSQALWFRKGAPCEYVMLLSMFERQREKSCLQARRMSRMRDIGTIVRHPHTVINFLLNDSANSREHEVPSVEAAVELLYDTISTH